jgi:hypothetical protein
VPSEIHERSQLKKKDAKLPEQTIVPVYGCLKSVEGNLSAGAEESHASKTRNWTVATLKASGNWHDSLLPPTSAAFGTGSWSLDDSTRSGLEVKRVQASHGILYSVKQEKIG